MCVRNFLFLYRWPIRKKRFRKRVGKEGIPMDTAAMLEELRAKVRRDPELRERFLKTRASGHPVASFCGLCRELGYELYEMDVISVGEDFYAAMRRSTNGGGENSPMLKMEDDFYELFFEGL